MLIDTHAHVNFNAFKEDSDAVLKRALANNTWVIMPGTQYSTSEHAVRIAEKYEEGLPTEAPEERRRGVYAAIGLHPIHLEERRVDVMEVQSEPIRQAQGKEQPWMTFETKAEEFDYERYKKLALSERSESKRKVVAVGECGLDYYYEPKGKEKRAAMRLKQKTALALQLKLAEELDLPIIFHCRKAHDDLLEFLNTRQKAEGHLGGPATMPSFGRAKLRGVVHCYTGDLKQAEQFYKMGLYFGFNGLIFKDVPVLPDPKEIIANIPLERIVLETDSPYLAPPQAKGVSDTPMRNEPLFVKYVAEEIARIKKIGVEEVAKVTTQNAKTLFQLSGA